jgi:hypothetical protein
MDTSAQAWSQQQVGKAQLGERRRTERLINVVERMMAGQAVTLLIQDTTTIDLSERAEAALTDLELLDRYFAGKGADEARREHAERVTAGTEATSDE